MPRPSRAATIETRRQETLMWFVFGGLAAILYLVLIVTLGVTTLRKGHWVMFVIGIFMPLFWIIGALMPPTPQAASA